MKKHCILAGLLVSALSVGLSFCQVYAADDAPVISEDAKALLSQIGDAYSKLQSIKVEASLTSDIDAGGRVENFHSVIDGSADSSARFVSRVVDESIMIGDGKKTYAYELRRKSYIELDPLPMRKSLSELPELLVLLKDENPSVLMMLCSDPTAVLTNGYKTVALAPDTKLDSTSYQTLLLTKDERQVKMLIDPKTSLIRRMELDYSGYLKDQKVPDVKKALIILDYSKIVTNVATKPEEFAWTPPRGAIPSKGTADDLIQDGPTDGVDALVNKVALDVVLKDLDGNECKLADQKGKVVVMDFWATWCGPCVQLLPHVNAMNEKLKDNKDVVIWAVNCGESAEIAKSFMTKKEYSLTVLLDADGATQKRYGITGIPTTIVVGKDGKVAFVNVGFGGEETGTKIEEAVEKALKAK